jgi:hypothetical protein
MVPKDLRGNILYPLNTLKENHPDLYDNYIKKYEGRAEILDRRIEKLNCKWNDVLHCSALNPNIVIEALRNLGKDAHLKFFEIDAHKLEPENTLVYLYSPREFGTLPPQSDFIEYKPEEVEKYAYLPDETIEYYKKTLEAGKNPLGFHLVPHILYKGNIDISDAKVISV